MSERNGAFDRFRGLGALCVVLIHAPPFLHSSVLPLHEFGWGLRLLCQAAVPYFFLLSGWMLEAKARSSDHPASDAWRMLRRIAGLYLPWFALFLGFDIWRGAPHDPGSVLRRLLGFSDGRLDIQGYHLWFLPSLLWAQLLIFWAIRATRSVIPALLVGLALWIAMASLELAGVTLPWGLVPTEGVGVSLVSVALGAFLSRWRAWKPSGQVVLGLFAAILVEQALLDGAIGVLSIRTYLFARVVAPAALLLWMSTRPDFLGGGTMGRALDSLGRRSTGIYVSHILFLAIIPFDRFVSSGFVRDNFVRWPAMLLCAWGFSILLGRSSSRWIRALVS
jgi:surface polysaccharide O-acyltransferase-like enzyme